MRFLLFSFLIIFSIQSFASPAPVASVVKLRGTVTKLLPGSLTATFVVEGDKLLEDTSIVTGPKSFIKIKFIDNSELNMGPESKIVVSEMTPSSAGIISLLKGRIRTEVLKNDKKNEQNKNKFYIRTRTAAMGIRGTDFQTIYNPDNHVTSLLTYKGSVAMAKIDEGSRKRFENETAIVERDAQSQRPEIKKIPGKLINEEEELKRILAKEKTVIVAPGQSSFSSESLKNTSLPVNISPAQLNALYKNREFEEKSVANLKSALTKEGIKAEIPVVYQTTPTEGVVDLKNGKFAPKAGGFIDQKTGLYIAPDAAADFDEKNKVYASKTSGDIDADTGEYIAPQGLVLDAKLGFVVDKESSAKPQMLALREDLNKSIARDLVVGVIEPQAVVATRSIREKFIRNNLEFSFLAMDESIDITNQTRGTSSTIESDSAKKFILDWQMPSNNRFASLLGLSFTSIDFDSLTSRGFSQEPSGLLGLSTGLKYALTAHIDLVGKVHLDQKHYAVLTSSSPEVYSLKRIVLTKLELGANFEFLRSKYFSLGGSLYGGVGLRKRFNDLVISDLMTYSLKIAPQYHLNDKQTLSLGLFTKSENAELSNSFGIIDHERESSGLDLTYAIAI